MLLQTLRQWLGQEKDSPTHAPLLGMREADVARLRLWWSDLDARQAFLEALDRQCNIHAEALLLARDSTDVHMQQGTIHGLRRAATLVDELIAAHESAKRSAAGRNAERDAEHASRVVSLYGSPAFGRVANR